MGGHLPAFAWILGRKASLSSGLGSSDTLRERMSTPELAAVIQATESDDEAERERAIGLLAQAEAPQALVVLERLSVQDDNLQIRFLAKEAALRLRHHLSGPQKSGAIQAAGQKLDLEHLRSRLSSKDPERRLRGVRSSLASKDSRALPLLRKLLQKEADPKLQVELCHTIGALGSKGEGTELLVKLEDSNPTVRAAAVRGLTYLKDPSVYPTLVAMLQDRDREVRATAMDAMRRLGRRRLVRLLLRMIKSKRTWPRKAAIRACARIHGRDFLKILVKVRKKDEDPQIRRDAVKAIYHIAKKGDETAQRVLEKSPPVELQKRRRVDTDGLVIDRADQGADRSTTKEESMERIRQEVERVREQSQNTPEPPPSYDPPASPGEGSHQTSVSDNLPQPPLEILDFEEDPDQSELEDLELSTAEVMVGGLHDPDPEVRMANLKEILTQKDRSLAQQLAARLPLEKDERVLTKLLLAVGRLGRKKDSRRVVRYLDHIDNRVRANAVEALSLLGDEASIRQTEPLLDDADNRVRANAVVALSEFPDVDVLSSLKVMSKHPETDMRLSAIYAALEIGSNEVDDILSVLLNDKEPQVQKKALSAINLLEDQRTSVMDPDAPDMGNTVARFEKLSAWRGEELDLAEEEDDALEAEADEILEELQGPSETDGKPKEDVLAKQRPGSSWNKKSKPGSDKAASGSGLGASILDRLQEMFASPLAPQEVPKSGKVTDGPEGAKAQNIATVLLLTLAICLVLYFLLGGGDAGGLGPGTDPYGEF